MTSWSEIWNKRSLNSKDAGSPVALADLLRVNGYDTSTAGQVSGQDFEQYHRYISEKCRVLPGDSLFEVGMGGGAFLLPWYQNGHPVGGLDYSRSLVSIARRAMPDAQNEFMAAEASALDTTKPYDIVLSNGVFLYFPDHRYARTVAEKMIQKATKTIAILDVPDQAQQEETEKFRRSSLPPGEYKRRYQGLEHLYFPRSWFSALAEAHGLAISIFDQDIHNYGNSRFRFNVVMKKE